ncbi:MAG TPA: type II secretion system protein [Pantanalinema sp.]
MQGRQRGFTLMELTLTVAIAMVMLAGSMWALKQHNAEARVQQSKVTLATLRTQIASFRYRVGRFPKRSEIYANGFIPGMASVSEAVSGVPLVYLTGEATPSWGGWLYDEASGIVAPNLDPVRHPGDLPSLW